ncbi:hypothetical protein [Streptomyces sp. NPDC092307]
MTIPSGQPPAGGAYGAGEEGASAADRMEYVVLPEASVIVFT